MSSVSFVVLLSLAGVVLAQDIPSCREVSYGVACTGLTPTLAATAEGELLIVGGKNSLYSFQTVPALHLKEAVSLKPDDDTISDCERQVQSSECDNLVRIVQVIPRQAIQGNATLEELYNDTVLVCGTNAFFPKCTVHKRTNLTERTNLIEGAAAAVGFVPYSVASRSIGLLATNGKFYTGVDFGKFSKKVRIAVNSHALENDRSFLPHTLENNPLWLFSSTQFISVYEIGDHIYIFAKEPAFEVNKGNTITYSRVIRICKTDEGIQETVAQIQRFRTFQKARLTCPHQRESSAPTFFYDNIMSTYLYWPTGSPLPTLYATFSSSVNGPEGTAICKFSFNSGDSNDINSLFGDAQYYFTDQNSNLMTESESAFVCPQSPSGRQRTDREARDHQLAVGLINGGLITKSDGQTFTAIAVDVFTFNRSTYEMMFIGTEDGNVRAVMNSVALPNAITFDLLTPDAENVGHPITQLILSVSNATKVRRLYTITDRLLVDITLGNCSKYVSCIECLESHDPYCAWQGNLCINKLLDTQTLQISEAISPPANISSYCRVSSSTMSTNTIITSQTSSLHIFSSTMYSPSPIAASTTEAPTSVLASMTTSLTTTYLSYSTSTILPTVVSSRSVATTTITSTTNSVISTVRIVPSVGPLDTSGSKLAIGQTVGALVGGLLVGFLVGTVVCCVVIVVKRARTKNGDEVIANNHQPNSTTNRQRHGSVGHYTITVDLPKGDENFKAVESPSPLPSAMDSELEDDAISELPVQSVNHYQGRRKRHIPRGRTESTQWLKASESDDCPPSPSSFH